MTPAQTTNLATTAAMLAYVPPNWYRWDGIVADDAADRFAQANGVNVDVTEIPVCRRVWKRGRPGPWRVSKVFHVRWR